MKLKWRNPKKDLPKVGEVVWVLMEHWKKEGALSCEIFCGEVEVSNDGKQISAYNNDYIGSGGVRWTIWQSEDFEYPSDSPAKAWLPVDELNIEIYRRHSRFADSFWVGGKIGGSPCLIVMTISISQHTRLIRRNMKTP